MASTGGNGQDSHDPYDSLDFPCRFQIKVVGKSTNRFSALAEEVMTRHLGRGDILNVSSRASRGRKYTSLTYTIMAQDKEQIRAIYRDLSQCQEVLFAL